ncbi:MAG TPA: hypothetical protein VFB74_34030 [Kribbellaceae bacterium]|nr:hypothetical protein [Kribbellaceae bacterium]
MRRLGYLTYREYASVILFARDWLTVIGPNNGAPRGILAALGAGEDPLPFVVPIVLGPDDAPEPFDMPKVVDPYRWRAVERYIWQTRCLDPNRRFWHDGGS